MEGRSTTTSRFHSPVLNQNEGAISNPRCEERHQIQRIAAVTLSAGSHVQGFLVSEVERNFENVEKLYDKKEVVQNERIHFFFKWSRNQY